MLHSSRKLSNWAMPMHPFEKGPPPCMWSDLLLDFESVGSTKADVSIYVRTRRSILVAPHDQITGKGDWAVDVLSPQGTSAWAAINSYMTWDHEERVGSAKLLWDVTVSQPSNVHQFWLVHACGCDDFEDVHDYHIDSDTVVIPVGDGAVHQQRIRILEMFAGSYGGWGKAMQHFTKHFQLQHQTIAIENDLRLCCYYAVSHGVPIISGYEPMEPEAFMKLTKGCIVHADATSQCWLPPAGVWRPHVICMSSPCPPWSKAADCPGMHSMQGMIFPEAILVGKWLKPHIMLLENVAGVPQHEHFCYLVRTIQHVGYKIHWSGVIELSSTCPVNRPRWLAILTRVNCEHVDELAMQFMTSISSQGPLMYKSVLFNDLIDYNVLGITTEVKRILSNARYSPGPKKARVDPKSVFDSRCKNGWTTLPCFLASYGTQHHMVNESNDRSCLTHLARIGDAEPRYWHPVEVFLHHQASGNTLLPINPIEAWRGLGNQIAVPHAAVLLHNALRMLRGVAWDHGIQEVECSLDNHRIHSGNMRIQQTMCGLWITHQSDTVHDLTDTQIHGVKGFLSMYGDSFMPEGYMWDVDGFQTLNASVHRGELNLSPITPPTVIESPEDQVIEATAPMPIYVSIRMSRDDVQARAWALSNVQPTSLPIVWKGLVLVDTEHDQKEHDDMDILKLVPSQEPHDAITQQAVVACWLERTLTIHTVEADSPMKPQILKHVADCRLFDAFGELTGTQKSMMCDFCCDFFIRHMNVSCDLAFCMAAFQSCLANYQYFAGVDHWVVRICGERPAVATLVTVYANSLCGDDMFRLGRTFRIDYDDHGAFITFMPVDTRIPVPPRAFEHIMAVAVTKGLLDKMPKDNPQEVTFKWLGRPFWKGMIDRDLDASTLETIFQLGFAPVTNFQCQRLVCLGKRLFGKIKDLDHVPEGRPIKIHLIGETWGGGGNGISNGAKNQHKQQVKNSIATSLLEQGVDLTWVHQNVDRMIEALGVARVVPVAGQQPGTVRDSRISQLFADANLPLPPYPKRGVTTPQSLRVKQKKKALSIPNPTEYRINCDYLLNEDGSNTQQIQELRGQSTGTLLTSPQAAEPWIREGAKLSADELGMIVMGPSEECAKLSSKPIVLPCFDVNNQQVLIHGVLYQLGEKHLKVKPWDTVKPTKEASKVCAITLWQTDWSPEQWKTALGRTHQFLKEVLQSDGLDAAIENSWGRSLRKGKSVASVHDATSMQVHANINPDRFQDFLAASGFNRLWVIPKEDGGALTANYCVIWLQHLKQDMQKIQTTAAQAPKMSGLVRGRSSYGLRIPKESFNETWRRLFPDEEPPVDMPSSHVFRLEPLPFGTNAHTLKEWSALIRWPLRPIRALGATAWLVCTGELPPVEVLSWNGNPVLATKLPPKQVDRHQAIVAGPRASAVKQVPGDVSNSGTAPPGAKDPWAVWQANHGQQSAPAGPPRQLQGPIEQKLSGQDARIKTLEDKMATLCGQQECTSQQLQALQAATAGVETRLSEQLTQAVSAVKQDLNQAFTTALNQQTSTFNDSLRDIKLLLSKSKRKTAEGQEDDDMSS
eukprot:Skav224952  [mRNA]  locus=scaffold1186:117104:121789:+ [translate_table: standard]